MAPNSPTSSSALTRLPEAMAVREEAAELDRTAADAAPGRADRPDPDTGILRRAMGALHWACAAIAGSALVVISIIVPWGVYTRYVLDSAASWPEPMAILLSIVLTFFGGTVCYRTGT